MSNMYASFYDAKTKKITKDWSSVKDCAEDRLTYHEAVILQMYETMVEICQGIEYGDDITAMKTMATVAKLAAKSMYDATEMYRYDTGKMRSSYEANRLNDSDTTLIRAALSYACEQTESSEFDVDPLGYADEPIYNDANYYEALAAMHSDIEHILNKLNNVK